MPLVEQIKIHFWTGNDTSRRGNHVRAPLAEIPFFVSLSWRKDRSSKPAHVADLKLDLPELLAEHLVRKISARHVLVRFVHERDGSVSLQTKSGAPRLRVGRAPG